MPSKWDGVPIRMVPLDERNSEITRRQDEANRKKQAESEASPNAIAKVPTDEDYSDEEKHIDTLNRSPMDVMTKMNAPSIFSRGLHSGMISKSGAQRVNIKRVPDSPMGTQMVAKQDRDRPLPVIRSLQSKEESEKIERLRKELDVARRQIELDEQDKESLRETIEKQKKRIADLESRPIVTDEMQLKLLKYDQSLKKGREREKRFIERHSQE